MKKHLVPVVLASIVSLIVMLAFLMTSDDNWVGFAGLALLVGSFFFTLIRGHSAASLLLCMVPMHWMQLEALTWSLQALGLCLLLSLAIQLSRKNLDIGFVIRALLWFVGFNCLLFILGPNKIGLVWYYMNGLGFMALMWSQGICWNRFLLDRFILAQLAFMILYVYVEYAITDYIRAAGPTISATAYAVLLVILWTIWFVNTMVARLWSLFTVVVITFGTFIAVIMSGTRMGLIGIAMGLSCGLLFRFLVREKRFFSLAVKLVMTMVVMLALLTSAWFLLPNDFFIKNTLNMLVSGQLDMSSLGRIFAWLTALDVIQKYPLWGIGAGNFLQYNESFLESFAFLQGMEMVPRLGHAHNIYLLVLSEHGIIGALALGVLVVWCGCGLIKRLRKNRKDSVALALIAGGVVMASLGMLDAIPFFPSTIAWGGWFLGAMASRPDESEEKEMD